MHEQLPTHKELPAHSVVHRPNNIYISLHLDIDSWCAEGGNINGAYPATGGGGGGLGCAVPRCRHIGCVVSHGAAAVLCCLVLCYVVLCCVVLSGIGFCLCDFCSLDL